MKSKNNPRGRIDRLIHQDYEKHLQDDGSFGGIAFDFLAIWILNNVDEFQLLSIPTDTNSEEYI